MAEKEKGRPDPGGIEKKGGYAPQQGKVDLDKVPSPRPGPAAGAGKAPAKPAAGGSDE